MKQKKLPLGVRFLLGLVSFVLCILLFVSTIVTILVADVRFLTSKGTLESLIQEALFGTSFSEPVSSSGNYARPAVTFRTPKMAMPHLSEASSSSGLQDQLIESIYEMLSSSLGGELPITLEQVEDFIAESTLSEFLPEKISGIVSDVINGTNTTSITIEEVEELLKDNAQLISDTFNIPLTEKEIEAVVQGLEESKVLENLSSESIQDMLFGGNSGSDSAPDNSGNSGSSGNGGSSVNSGVGNGSGSGSGNGGNSTTTGIGSILGSDTFAGGLLNAINGGKGELDNVDLSTPAGILQLVRSLTSVNMLAALIGLCVLIVALLLLVNIKQLHTGIKDAGVTFLLAGIIMAVPFAVAMAIPAMLESLIPMGLGSMAKKLLMTTVMAPGIVAGLGLVLIICGAVIKSVGKKKLAAAMAAPVVVEAPVATMEAFVPASVEVPEETPEAFEETLEEQTEEEAPAEEAVEAEEVPAE